MHAGSGINSNTLLTKQCAFRPTVCIYSVHLGLQCAFTVCIYSVHLECAFTVSYTYRTIIHVLVHDYNMFVTIVQFVTRTLSCHLMYSTNLYATGRLVVCYDIILSCTIVITLWSALCSIVYMYVLLSRILYMMFKYYIIRMIIIFI